MGGKILCLTGLDGCGKSTQIKLLCNWLTENNVRYTHIRLQDIPVPQRQLLKDTYAYIKNNKLKIKSHPILESIYLGFRTVFIHDNIICPNTDNNVWVIAERYLESNDLYLMRNGIDPSHYNQIINKKIKPANITIVIQLSADLCYTRIKERGCIAEHEQMKHLVYSERFFENNRNEYNFYLIDGTKSIGDVFHQITAVLEKQVF